MAVQLRKVNRDLLRLHVEEAGFLLMQRDLALEAPNYRLIDIYDIEQRLHGHLDALVLAGHDGAEAATSLSQGFGEECLGVLLHIAMRQQRLDLIETAVELAREDPGAFLPHLGRAAAWCQPEVLALYMRDWLSSRESLLRWIALEVCGRHRVDPKRHVTEALDEPDATVRRRAIELAGELGRTDCLDRIRGLEASEASIAAMLLGDRGNLEPDSDIFLCAPRTARRAAELFPLAMAPADAQATIRGLLARPATRRWGIVALGAMGEAGALRWLLETMAEPRDARVAVSAFERITGLYFAHDGLELAEFPEGPADPVYGSDPGETLIEANTPWPDLDKVRVWLDRNAARFSEAERLAFGVACWSIGDPPESWIRFQSRYRAVALCQAVRQPSRACPNWRSPVVLHGGGFTRSW